MSSTPLGELRQDPAFPDRRNLLDKKTYLFRESLDDYRFLGVVSGYYFEDSDFKLHIATTVTGKQHANSGISIIVPADLLKDLILNNRELAAIRDANVPAPQAKK